MSTRQEYCIVNQLDDHYDNIKGSADAGREAFDELRKLFGCLDLPDRDKFDDLLETISETFSEIDSECDELNDLIDGADTFARENLESERESGYEDGMQEGYQQGFDDALAEQHDDAEREGYERAVDEYEDYLNDCIDHYESMVRDIVDDFLKDADPIDRINRTKKVDADLEDEKFTWQASPGSTIPLLLRGIVKKASRIDSQGL